MILRLLFSTLLVWASFQTKVQGQKNEYKIDSVFVYKNFDQCGTTANLWQNHRVLDSLKYAKRKFSQEDIKNLDDMLKLFKTKRLLQQKYGGEICYLIIYRNGIGKRFVLIFRRTFVHLMIWIQ